MLIPYFFLDDRQYYLGQKLEEQTLKLLNNQISSSLGDRIEVKPCSTYLVETIYPKTIFRNLACALHTPEKYIIQLFEKKRLRCFTKYFDQNPGVLLYCSTRYYFEILPFFEKYENSIINRLDYGKWFAIIVPNSTNEKAVKEAFLCAIDRRRFRFNEKIKCHIVTSGKIIKNICISKVTEVLINFLNSPSRIYPIKFNLTLRDDEVSQLYDCSKLAYEFKEVANIHVGKTTLHIPNETDLRLLENEISASYLHPKNCLIYAYKMHIRLSHECLLEADVVKYLKEITALKSLLQTCLNVVKTKFEKHNGYYYLLCSDEMLWRLPSHTPFFISDGSVYPQSIICETFMKSGWHFIKTTNSSKQENYLILNAENRRYRGYGYINFLNTMQCYKPNCSREPFVYTCPCNKSPLNNYWICLNCTSFFYYHRKNRDLVSCKCYSSDIYNLSFVSAQIACKHHGPINLRNPKNEISNLQQIKKYNVLIMGQSGTGKSTLVNSIANYLNYKTLKIAKDINEVTHVIPCKFEVFDKNYDGHVVSLGIANPSQENFNLFGQSVTQAPHEYSFKISEHESINIMDTPGLADSRGVDQDDHNLQLINDAILKLDYLHALCFVLKPNESKLSLSLESSMRHLLSLFPQEAIQNVIFCFTNSKGTFYRPGDSMKPINRLIDELYKECGVILPFGKQNVFCFDNEGFRYLCTRAYNIKFAPFTYKEYEDSWEKSHEATLAFINHLKIVKPFDIQLIKFYQDLIELTNVWHKWLVKIHASNERIKRFGIISMVLKNNIISKNSDNFLNFAKSYGFEVPSNIEISKNMVFNNLYLEQDDINTDTQIQKCIKYFLNEHCMKK